MARKKKSQGGGSAGAPLFMATYGDMVTLLLTFFVLLFSFSTIDVQKFEKMIFSFQAAVGVLPGGNTMSATKSLEEGSMGRDAGNADTQTQEFKESIARQLQALAKNENVEKAVTVTVNQRGVVVSLSEQFVFDPGSIELRVEARRILFKIGEVLKNFPNMLAVEGNTDNSAFESGVYGDNWGLSAARASVVASYLDKKVGLNPNRLQAVGYGSNKPLVPNDTPEHRALNRRVDLVLLTDYPLDN